MKRFWVGVAITALLLGLGITVTVGMHRICLPISQALEQAAHAEDWASALALSRRARADWERWQQLSAAVTDHEPMEEIDALYHALEIYAKHEDVLRFSEACAQLSSMTEAIAESQSVNWWHIF